MHSSADLFHNQLALSLQIYYPYRNIFLKKNTGKKKTLKKGRLKNLLKV